MHNLKLQPSLVFFFLNFYRFQNKVFYRYSLYIKYKNAIPNIIFIF